MTVLRGLFTIDEASAYLQREPEVTLTQLAPRLWTVTADSYRTVFAEGRTSVIAVNTFGTPAAAAAYRNIVAQTVPGKPIGTIIQTIDHLDHTGYGRVLAPDAEVITHELAAAVISGRGADGQLPPTRLVHGQGEKLELDGVSIEIRYPAPTVGTGNLGVYLPDARAMFIVGPQAGVRYGLFPDVHFRHLVPGLRELFSADVDVVVPGRRDAMDCGQAMLALDYLDDFQDACQHALVTVGLKIWLLEPVGEYLHAALSAKWGHLDGFGVRMLGLGGLRCINHYYMGGWGLEDTQEPERLYGKLAPPR